MLCCTGLCRLSRLAWGEVTKGMQVLQPGHMSGANGEQWQGGGQDKGTSETRLMLLQSFIVFALKKNCLLGLAFFLIMHAKI